MQKTNAYILIVDDDPEDRQALIDELARQQPALTVKQLEGGRELLDFLDECAPDHFPAVIVLDYQMPDVNGPDVLSNLSTDDRFRILTIVMWSTSPRTKDIEECKRLGAADYLVKPHSMEELTKSIHKMLTYFRLAVDATA